jgi:hypothetical protein
LRRDAAPPNLQGTDGDETERRKAKGLMRHPPLGDEDKIMAAPKKKKK